MRLSLSKPSALVPLLIVAFAAVTSARPQRDVPRNDGWVTDLAGMLDAAQEQSLESLMESYRAGTGHEIALLTVPELGGEPIDRLALETARAWGLGGKDEHDGALLVVAQKDRKLRIEVGRGLEGGLTDAISGRIIRDVIAPEMRTGDAYTALRSGIEAMHAAIGGDYGPIRTAARGQSSESALAGLIPLAYFLFVFVMLARRRGGSRLRGGALPWIVLNSLGTHRGGGGGGGGFGGGGFGGFGGGGGFSGGGSSGGW